MISVEIELKSPDSRNDIYELRKYLQENIEGLQIHIKEQPVAEGQMTIGLAAVTTILSLMPEPVLKGTFEVTAKLTAEAIYYKVLRPIIHNWFGTRGKSAGADPDLEIMSTLSDDNSRIHFLEDSGGGSMVFDSRKYAIDINKTRAVLIGVGEFAGGFASIPPVKGNLEDFYQLLVDKKHIGLPRENIIISYNETQHEIIRHLLKASRAENTETLLIYFVGHGHRTDIKKLCLIARDSEKVDDEILSGIDFDFISNKILKGSSAKQKILILDACHSGIATQGDDNMMMDIDVKGSYILASSPGDEVSYFDKGGRNTYFTGAVIDLLKQGIDNTHEMLALEDIYDYTKNHLEEKQFPQPIVKSELNIPPSNFFIARNPLFSAEKLKQRALHLYQQRRLEEAMDKYRLLIKQYPNDLDLRKDYEQCENELSFVKLQEEANKYFYQYNDYRVAYDLYLKASRLKSDPIILDKMKDCETRLKNMQEKDPLEELRQYPAFIEYLKLVNDKNYSSALNILRELKKTLPQNKFLIEQIPILEKKKEALGTDAADGRLNEYKKLVSENRLEEALQVLEKMIIDNPSNSQYRAIRSKLEDKIRKMQEECEKLASPKKRKAIILGSVAVIFLVYAFFKWIAPALREHKPSYIEMYAMLRDDPDKAISFLQQQEKDNDSASLLLGDYYRNLQKYTQAEDYYSHARDLPIANTRIGELYYNNFVFDDAQHSKALAYFKKADQAGKDTLAWFYLGQIAENKYDKDFEDSLVPYNSNVADADWKEAETWYKKGADAGSINAMDKLAYLYYRKAWGYFDKKDFSDAYPLMESAASLYQKIEYPKYPDAIAALGYMYYFQDQKYQDLTKAKLLYKLAADKNSPLGLNNLASLYMSGKAGVTADCTKAFNLLTKALSLNSNLAIAYGNLGWLYQNGCAPAVVSNMTTAIEYYKKGAHLNDDFCTNQLKALNVNNY